MTQPDHTSERADPHRLLADADAAFAAGDHDLGSTLLWKSAECALIDLAKRLDRPHATDGDDLFFFSRWLDEQNNTRAYFSGYTAASLFGDNAKYHFIHPEEMDFSLPRVRKFIAALTSYGVTDQPC